MSTQAASRGEVVLSQFELEVIATCFKTSSTKLKPDYEEVARKHGLAHKNSAYQTFWRIQKKLGLTTKAPMMATTAGPAKKRGTKRTRKDAENEEDEGEDEDDAGDADDESKVEDEDEHEEDEDEPATTRVTRSKKQKTRV